MCQIAELMQSAICHSCDTKEQTMKFYQPIVNLFIVGLSAMVLPSFAQDFEDPEVVVVKAVEANVYGAPDEGAGKLDTLKKAAALDLAPKSDAAWKQAKEGWLLLAEYQFESQGGNRAWVKADQFAHDAEFKNLDKSWPVKLFVYDDGYEFSLYFQQNGQCTGEKTDVPKLRRFASAECRTVKMVPGSNVFKIGEGEVYGTVKANGELEFKANNIVKVDYFDAATVTLK